MKHIVCSGCSFTRQEKRLNIDGTDADFMLDFELMYKWPHYIKKYTNDNEFQIYNLGNPTNDNSVIRKSIIWKINELLKSGIKSENIHVFVQWSSWQRNSFFISPKHSMDKNTDINLSKNENKYAHISDFIKNKKNPGEYGYYLLTGGGMCDHLPYPIKKLIPEYYLNFYSLEESLIRFFENILFLQSYLQNKNIKYLCFNLQNNFSNFYTQKDGFPSYWDESDIFKSLYIDKYIPKTIDTDFEISYNNEYIDHLFEQINFENFWFLENDETKYGGLMEWAIKRYDIYEDKNIKGLWMEWSEYDMELLKIKLNKNNVWPVGHISNLMNELFVKENLLNLLL